MREITPPIWIALASFASLFFSACGGGGVSENHSNRGLVPGVGPFDKRGNYVESWADDKSKGVAWRSNRVVGEAEKEPKKEVAVVRTVPKIETKTPVVASRSVTSRSARKQTASVRRTRTTPPVVSSTKSRSKPRVTSRPQVASRPKVASQPKAKAAVKVKPRHKSPVRYTIKKGDTLYALSRKYKTSVSSIQRANGLRGTNLRIGRTLLIPRY